METLALFFFFLFFQKLNLSTDPPKTRKKIGLIYISHCIYTFSWRTENWHWMLRFDLSVWWRWVLPALTWPHTSLCGTSGPTACSPRRGSRSQLQVRVFLLVSQHVATLPEIVGAVGNGSLWVGIVRGVCSNCTGRKLWENSALSPPPSERLGSLATTYVSGEERPEDRQRLSRETQLQLISLLLLSGDWSLDPTGWYRESLSVLFQSNYKVNKIIVTIGKIIRFSGFSW